MAWTSAVRTLTSEATKEGWAAFAIAIILDVSTETAFDLLSDPDYLTGNKRQRNKYTAKDMADIENLTKSGLSWKEIGEIYGRSASGMCHLYKYYQEKKGVKRRRGGKYTEQDLEKMGRLKASGMTWKQVGEVFNMGPNNACQRYKKYLKKKGAK